MPTLPGWIVLGIAMLSLVGPAQASTNVVAIIINTNLQPLIQSHLDRYMADITSEGYVPLVRPWNTTGADQDEPAELRNYLGTVGGLTGAVFIGDLPVAQFYNPEDFTYGPATFPFDLYYMDLDVTWVDTNADTKIDLPTTSGINPRIWVSRIKASGMSTFSGCSEADLVKRYFDKNHRFRTGELRLPDRGLMWADSDWSGYTPSSAGIGFSYANCDRVTQDMPGVITDKPDWQSRWKHGYEAEFFMCHSSETSHDPGGGVSSSEVASADLVRLFWNCWNCSSAKYTAGNYIAGVRMFTPKYGIAAIGSAKTGSMLGGSTFYSELNAGKSHGAAFRKWFQSNYSDVDWHRGMVLLGDGTLKLGRFHQAPVVPNTAPTISAIANVVVVEDQISAPVSFTVNDGQLAASNLILWASSSNSVVPPYNVTFGGSNDTRTLTVQSAANVSGVVTLTVSVCDGVLSASNSFMVTVVPTNDNPVCTLDKPNADCDVVAAGARIPLQATATDVDGNSSILRVDFFVDGAFACSNLYDGNNTYTGLTANLAAGSHAIVSKAFDNAGGVGTSATYTVRVVAPFGGLWEGADVGTPGCAGASGMDGANWVVAGGGDITGISDSCRLAWQQVSGDGEIVARIRSLENTDNDAKAGVMIRATLATNAVNVFTRMRRSSYMVCQQYRSVPNGPTTVTNESAALTLPHWVKVAKSGNVFTSYRSTNGANWVVVGVVTNNNVTDPFYAGLAVAARNNARLCTAEFDSISCSFRPADVDADSMADRWEVVNFGGTSASDGDPTDDPDGDGRDNLQEYISGTCPTSPASCFAVEGVATTNAGAVTFWFDTVTDRLYSIDYATSMVPPEWFPYTNFTGSGLPVWIRDPASEGQMYYQLKVRMP